MATHYQTWTVAWPSWRRGLHHSQTSSRQLLSISKQIALAARKSYRPQGAGRQRLLYTLPPLRPRPLHLKPPPKLPESPLHQTTPDPLLSQQSLLQEHLRRPRTKASITITLPLLRATQRPAAPKLLQRINRPRVKVAPAPPTLCL